MEPSVVPASLRREIHLGFALAIVVLAITGTTAVQAIRRSYAQIEERALARQRLTDLRRAFRFLLDAQTGQRGFLLTGRESYAEPYAIGVDSLGPRLAALHAGGPPGQGDLARVQSFVRLSHAAVAHMAATMALRRSQGPAAAVREVETGRGTALMDSVRSELAALEDVREEAVRVLDARIRRSGSFAVRMTIVAGSLAVLLLVAALVMINRDMARREASEAQARESEDRLFQLLDGLPVAVFVTDGTGKPYFTNRAMREMVGADLAALSVPEILERHPVFLQGTSQPYPPERLPLATALAGGHAHVTDITQRMGDRLVPLEVWASPVRAGDGTVASVVVVVSDVEEQRRTERELRDLTAELTDLYEEAPCGYHSLDADGTVIRINRTELAWLGYDRDEVVGRLRIADLLTPESRARFVETFPVFKERGWLRNLEMELVRRNGTVLPVLINATAVRDDQGRFLMSRSSVQDITERRTAEDAARAARDAAEAANRAKSDFLAKMSHELRTPLNSVIGFSEMLQDGAAGPLADRQHRYVANVLSGGRQLLQLINDVLDLSKIEAGRMELSRSAFDVATAIREAEETVSVLAGERGLTLAADVEPGLPPLVADRPKVKQVLYNLLSNAIKYTPSGGRVTVAARRLARSPDGEPGIEIAVTDTGIGIAPEDRARIFREFEQVDSAFVRQQQGTGLGLALTTRLLTLHGGTISVESELDRGSVFRAWLPLRSRAGGAGEAVAGPDHGTAPLVLVVEDDDAAAQLLLHYLAAAGFRGARAVSGADALRLARELRPDAISLDILLGDRDGLDVLSSLKGAPETAGVPVVVVSVTDTRELGFSLGAAEWLVKPIRRETFAAAIRRVVASGPGETRTVLIVDDDPAALEVLGGYLATEGFRVTTATGGRDGIAKALTERPDLLVLDLLMPGVNGFDVVRALRADARGRGIPILVCTAKDVTAEERESLRGSVLAVVAKADGRDALLGELARAGVRPPGPA